MHSLAVCVFSPKLTNTEFFSFTRAVEANQAIGHRSVNASITVHKINLSSGCLEIKNAEILFDLIERHQQYPVFEQSAFQIWSMKRDQDTGLLLLSCQNANGYLLAKNTIDDAEQIKQKEVTVYVWEGKCMIPQEFWKSYQIS